MLWYIGRRVLQMIPVFLGATLLIYAMVFLLPGDPIAALAGDKALSPAVAQQLRERYHLDLPFYQQYLLYLKGIFTLDFGTSFSGRPVSEVLAQAFPITMKLAFMALIVETVFGVGFGLIAGLRKGGFFDSTVLLFSLVLIAIPIFVIGFLAQFFIGVKWGIVPPTVGGNTSFMVSFVTILIVIYLIANLLVDLLYAALDPRIRYV
ncbi:MAG: ABC transporter permease [Rhodococcus sp. (in: high G+C Gram-positive bacteria)]|uniref:ABC transporter permease n=1 Tax=Rhodococcus sp. TaxID=1831 RepID=UPI00121342E2|nr:ABC transporter permease [Rhodococcus sp. (in: high G+C Gram-positive bacteria)]RZL21985.1 MAG: ABC transporter permease [Rhodococcus sp. (in: high G+C Gram-positive bacteria)]